MNSGGAAVNDLSGETLFLASALWIITLEHALLTGWKYQDYNDRLNL